MVVGLKSYSGELSIATSNNPSVINAIYMYGIIYIYTYINMYIYIKERGNTLWRNNSTNAVGTKINPFTPSYGSNQIFSHQAHILPNSSFSIGLNFTN